MKAFSVFKKNMKVVSRNWTYFAVLFLCPLLLISVASFALNSADISNVDYIYDFKGGHSKFGKELGLEKFPYPVSREPVSCLRAFRYINDLGFCISKQGQKNYRVYLDNTNQVGASRAKKVLLEKIAKKQSYEANQTSTKIDRKVGNYLFTLNESEKKLEKTYEELEEQEEMLQGYKEKIDQIQEDFDRVYDPTKNSIQKIRSSSNVDDSKKFLEEVNKSQEKLGLIKGRLDAFDGFLSGSLGDSRYNAASEYLKDVRGNLSEINDSLNIIKNASFAEDIKKVDRNLKIVEDNLDEIKDQLDKMERDIDSALKSTRESQNEIRGFQDEISGAKEELANLSGSVGDVTEIEFVDKYPLPDDPVFLKFPLLVALIIVFTSLVLSNMFILKKVGESSYSRELFSPLSSSEILFSDYLANMVFILVQSIVIFGFGIYMFNLSFGFAMVFFLAILLISSILLFFGMGVGYILRNKNISILITVFLLMSLLMLSSAMVPPMMASSLVSFIMDFNPLEILTSILSSSFFLSRDLSSFGPYVSNLVVLFVSGLAFLTVSQKINKKKTLH